MFNSWLFRDGKNTEGQISVANYDTVIFKMMQHPCGINLNEHISLISTALWQLCNPFDVRRNDPVWTVRLSAPFQFQEHLNRTKIHILTALKYIFTHITRFELLKMQIREQAKPNSSLIVTNWFKTPASIFDIQYFNITLGCSHSCFLIYVRKAKWSCKISHFWHFGWNTNALIFSHIDFKVSLIFFFSHFNFTFDIIIMILSYSFHCPILGFLSQLWH